ncbi:MAG: endonuclease III [Candidatus Peribacteraceae bacterium]|nr:endonuclease III [Candidatus Peribacteraceae bacterium]
MPRRNAVSVHRVIQDLESLYDPPRSFLTWETPFELLIATILSARCTDAQVNKVTPGLFRTYRTPEDYVKASVAAVEKDIHSCGTFRMKTKNIRSLCRKLIEEFGGKVPQTMQELVSLSGVGRKTASIVLYAAFGQQEGIAVDTHVQRLSLRLGLSMHQTPEKIERDLMAQVPREKWGVLNTLMISHGRAVCTGRNRKCGACIFKDACPSSLTRGKRDLATKRVDGVWQSV